MAREEIVFTKKALVVMATISTLGGIASVGWFAHLAISNIEKQAVVAISDVRKSVSSLEMAHRVHEASDDARDATHWTRINGLELRVLEMERDVNRLGGIIGDALPPDRRRKLKAP